MQQRPTGPTPAPEPHVAAGDRSVVPDATQALAPAGPDAPPPRRATRKPWIWITAAALAGAAGAWYWVLGPGHRTEIRAEVPHQTPPPSSAEASSPAVRPYLDQARAGDARAMHMLALMYWNGLNVRQDRTKGLEWYRKAAEAGDQAARQELQVIEGSR